MGEVTGIGWTDSTWNPWWGCTVIGPGCERCYAQVFSERKNKARWGDDQPRMRTGPATWNALDTWNRKAGLAGNKPTKVFCASMADFFDNHPDVDPWRREAWTRIKRCKHLRLQILTKRVSNIPKMLPPDWGPDYAHVGFMITVVNQTEVNRDVPRLLRIKQEYGVTWVGLSAEPMLDWMDLTTVRFRDEDADVSYNALTGESMVLNSDSADAYNDDGPKLDWVVIGGESERPLTAACRPYNMNAAHALIEQVQASPCNVFHKQLGSRPVRDNVPFYVKHWKGEVRDEWPDAFRVQEFPKALLQ